MTDNWKILFRAHSDIELQNAKNYLESERIPTFIQNELAAQIYGNAADKPKILVKEKYFERAMNILKEGGYLE